MKTNFTQDELRQLKILKEQKNKKFLEEFIIEQTEAQVENKFSDANLDKEVEKRKLLEVVSDYWKIKSIERNILRAPSEYVKIFPQEYYKEIYRLNGWPIPKIISNKPWIVGRFTNEIIYYRFSHEILPFIRIINPYKLPGKRLFKHHQYLTEGARLKLSQFIDDAIEEMKKHENWNDFRIAYCSKFNVPYQLKLFPENKAT